MVLTNVRQPCGQRSPSIFASSRRRPRGRSLIFPTSFSFDRSPSRAPTWIFIETATFPPTAIGTRLVLASAKLVRAPQVMANDWREMSGLALPGEIDVRVVVRLLLCPKLASAGGGNDWRRVLRRMIRAHGRNIDQTVRRNSDRDAMYLTEQESSGFWCLTFCPLDGPMAPSCQFVLELSCKITLFVCHSAPALYSETFDR